jgi:hypothetical protein
MIAIAGQLDGRVQLWMVIHAGHDQFVTMADASLSRFD